MIRWTARVTGLGVATLLALALISPAAAEVQTTDRQVLTEDPGSITFSIRVDGTPVTDAVLVHRRTGSTGTSVSGRIRAEVPSRGLGVITAELETNSVNTYIPVGTEFTYHWEFELEDGTGVETEPEVFVFLDGRFSWQSFEAEGLTVYWYHDRQVGATVFQATQDTIKEVGELLETPIDFPIRVVVWANSQDSGPAERGRGGVYDEQSVTGGSRVATNILHIYALLPGATWEDIARHELAHIVVARAGDGPFTRVPAWIDEGLATYAQKDATQRLPAVDFAVQTNTTLRLRNMSGPPNRAEEIDLFYGQSWQVVQHMIDEYGPEKIAALLRAIREGATTDEALEQVYGFDQDELYNEWRVTRGMEPIEFAPIVEATSIARPEGTRAPLALPTAVASGGTGATGAASVAEAPADDGGSSNVMTAAIIGLVTLVVAGGLGGFGLRMLRQKR